MFEAVEVFWSPDGHTVPNLGTMALVDITDGDTPNIRMPVRMLSVDTPELTARTIAGARAVDEKFARLAEWLGQRTDLPVSRRFADYLVPKLRAGAGTLHFDQASQASEFAKWNAESRLRKPDGTRRSLFVRTTTPPFDNYGRLLAYVAPNYTKAERQDMALEERATFNLDLVRKGWAVPFVIYPAIPGDRDLALLLGAATRALDPAMPHGIWNNPLTLPAYEYRAVEKLYSIAEKIVEGRLDTDPRSWRTRYCADMRTRVLHGPEDYVEVPVQYRLWIWPGDLNEAVGRLNLVPSRRLVGAGQDG